jgi:hypothetical protein
MRDVLYLLAFEISTALALAGVVILCLLLVRP